MQTAETIKSTALEIICKIAPEAVIAQIDPNVRFRDQFDFDSVDFMNFAISLQTRLDIAIPEEDYPRMSTLNGCIDYFLSRGIPQTPVHPD